MRYKVVNGNFPLTGPQSTDAYFAAFKIPDFFFFTLAAGALGVAFIPVLSDHLERGDKKGAWELSNSLLNLLSLVMFVVGLVMLIFARPLVHLVAPSLRDPQLHNAAIIMRFISFNPLLFALSGVLAGVQQTIGRFFFYAIGPLFYNLSIIISVYVFRNNVGLVGLGIGACVGALLQFLLILFGFFNTGYKHNFKINWKNRDFKLILRQLPPRSIDQGIDSINSIVETRLASGLGIGNISFYENAYILSTTPMILIGTTISTAAFPRLTARLSQGRPDLFRKEFLQILRAIFWIAMPTTVVCYFARGYFGRIIFAKNTGESAQISLIFGYLAGAILFRTLYAIISRWFYAQKDTVTPLMVSLFAILLNIVLAYSLSHSSYGVSGLAMAQSIVAALEVFVLVSVMVIRDHKLFDPDFLSGIMRTISVTGFSVLTAFIAVTFLPLNISDRGLITLGAKLGVISILTFAMHLGVSSLFGLEEANAVTSRIRKFILKPIKIT